MNFRNIDAELISDLCDVVAPSDVVTITGVVKAVPAADQSGEKPRKDLDHFRSLLSFFCQFWHILF